MPIHRVAFTHFVVYTNTFTHSFHQFFDAEILSPAGIFLHRNTLTLHGDVFLTRRRCFHAHMRARFSRDVFKRTCSYTEIVVHRDTFTQRCLHAQKRFHTYTRTLLHRDGFTLSNFTNRYHYKQRCFGAFY